MTYHESFIRGIMKANGITRLEAELSLVPIEKEVKN